MTGIPTEQARTMLAGITKGYQLLFFPESGSVLSYTDAEEARAAVVRANVETAGNVEVRQIPFDVALAAPSLLADLLEARAQIATLRAALIKVCEQMGFEEPRPNDAEWVKQARAALKGAE